MDQTNKTICELPDTGNGFTVEYGSESRILTFETKSPHR
jgi:hypothetical protein